VTAAYKAFDRRGAIWAFVTIFLFGALAPSVAPLVVSRFGQGADGIVIPAQLFLGPAAFAVTTLLYRRHPERTTAQWLAAQAAGQESPAPVPVRSFEPALPVTVAG